MNKNNFYNKGYSEAGASHVKRALRSFTPSSGSPAEDIDANNYTLRQRSRMLYMAAPVAAAAIKTLRTNVIGKGLTLKCGVNRELLGLSEETAEAWNNKTEAEFALWAERKEACDSTGVNNFYSMQQLAFQSSILSGDSAVLIKHENQTKNPFLPYSLRLHILEADRISTPAEGKNIVNPYTESRAENGNRIFDGVEVDRNGKVAAYYICNEYPDSFLLSQNEWQRIPAFGEKTGLPNVLQLMNTERPEQYRGVSILAQAIEPILQTRRYTESELTAAHIESMFTGYVTTARGDDDGTPFNETEPDNSKNIPRNENEYKLGAGTINFLRPGESIDFTDPKRPSKSFDVFMNAIYRQIGACIEIPSELLMKQFTNSYSASRAALLEAWKSFRVWRSWFVDDFCKPVYEIWLYEAVASGRIYAPGFFTDPIIRGAWLGAEFIGTAQGQLDPVKEITAEILAVEHGLSTHEQAAIRLNGSDWKRNIETLRVENELLKSVNGGLEMSGVNVNFTNE